MPVATPVGRDGRASFGDLIAGTGPSTEEEASSSLRDLAVRTLPS